MRRAVPVARFSVLLLLTVASTACSRAQVDGRSGSDRGWVRTGSALDTDLKHPTPLTVAPPETDSRDNGTPSAGRIVSGGTRSGGNSPNGPGTGSTGGPG